MPETPNIQINGKKYPVSELMMNQSESLRHDLRAIDHQGKIQTFINEWISQASGLNLQTSGSTGAPKKMVFSKQSVVKSARSTASFFDLEKNDKVLFCLPVDYIAGKMMVVRAFVSGLNLIPLKPSANPLSAIKESFRFAAMTPMQVHHAFKLPDGEAKLNAIETLIIGGGEISIGLSEKIQQLSNACWQTYGMTETLTHVGVRRLNGKHKSEEYSGLPGFEFRVDEQSCLCITSPYPEFPYVQTRDVVQLHSSTSFSFLGRIDFVINSGGVKLFPEKIEQRLQPFFKERFVLSSIENEITGQEPVLVVEGNYRPDISIHKIAIMAGLTKIESPKQILRLDSFPETGSGKINRLKIKEFIQQK